VKRLNWERTLIIYAAVGLLMTATQRRIVYGADRQETDKEKAERPVKLDVRFKPACATQKP